MEAVSGLDFWQPVGRGCQKGYGSLLVRFVCRNTPPDLAADLERPELLYVWPSQLYCRQGRKRIQLRFVVRHLSHLLSLLNLE